MKTKELVRSACCLVLSAALCAVGLSAFAGLVPVEYLDWDDVGKQMTNATCTAYTDVTNQMAVFDAGKTYVVANDVTVSSAITVNGTEANPTRLILCDGAKLTASAGVKVTVSGATTNALVICGQTLGTGALEATGVLRTAGIGGLSNDTPGESGTGGTVTINGGTVTATGGFCAAGIGGGWGGHGGTVTINGGTVTATGGNSGAGIGGGWGGAGGNVSINGGTVTATAGTDDEEAPTVAIGCCQESGDNGTVTFGAMFNVVTGETAAVTAPIAQDDYEKDHSAKYVHIEVPPVPEISALSNKFALDLTVGDRIAQTTETLVVDPAWGEATSATVEIDGESDVRTYMCASNDTWKTTTLTAGRYALALTAGTDNETAAFWKTGDDWVIFDSSNITADVTFEAGKTYLFFGTNTVDATLTVQDGAKLFYGEGALKGGFVGGTVNPPKRYERKTVEGDLYQIVEKIKGCEDNPWEIGDGVEAYTNGNELVIAGAGTIADLSEIPAEVKGGITAITITDAAVSNVLTDDAFQGVASGAKVSLALPDGWQGDLPDAEGNWYGAKTVLTRMPRTIKNVKPAQRYPWNGLVDVTFDLTGEGRVAATLAVTVDGVKLENPTVTGETTFDLEDGKELKDLKLTWDAGADFGDAEKHEKITVKLSVSPVEAD